MGKLILISLVIAGIFYTGSVVYEGLLEVTAGAGYYR